jgi:hypothetical protein
MWVSKTEFEDEESLEILNNLNANRQMQDEYLENNIQLAVKYIFS